MSSLQMVAESRRFGRRDPDARGYFGRFGGRFVPETLVAPIEELERAYLAARCDETFVAELERNIVEVLAEPINTRRTDNVTLLDLRVEKGVRLPKDRRAALFVDVYNLLNANPEEGLVQSSGPAFLQPLSIVAPRIARIGVKLNW